jgi:hypothetical protein
MKLKSQILNVYYTLQVGFSSTGWAISALTSTSVAVLAIHIIFPKAPASIVAISTPIFGILFFYFFGLMFLKHGGYSASQSFGGDANPLRLSWELEFRKANISIEQCYLLIKLAKLNNIDVSELEKTIEEIKEIRIKMQKLLNG